MKEKITKKIIRFFLFFIPIVLIIQYSNNPSLWNRFNLFEIYSISFLIITYVLFHFYDMLNDEKYFFYNSVAILLYQLSTVVIYSTGNLFLKYNPNMNLFTFDLTNIFGIGSQLFLFFGWRHFYLTLATDEK